MSLLEVKALTWTPHDAETPVFEGFSFALEPGEIAALTGPSGAGKSSVLRALVELVSPDAGEVYLDGRKLHAGWIREFRQKVALVFQKPASIAETVGQDLEFARTYGGENPLEVAEQDAMLERLGIDPGFRDRTFDSLSGGEQQRVQVVRSLTSGPRVVLLDEPTASLDDESERVVEQVLSEYLLDERALLWVSHSREQLERIRARPIALGNES